MSNLKSLGPLGVSPASNYGYVAGTSARFYGEGIINPKFFSWNAFFQIKVTKMTKQKVESIQVVPKGSFIYGYDGEVDGLEKDQDVDGDPTYVYIECDIDGSKSEITSAKIATEKERKPLFEPEEELKSQNKARLFLGLVKKSKPFYKFARNLSYPVIQSCYSVPIAIPSCINGFRGILLTTA